MKQRAEDVMKKLSKVVKKMYIRENYNSGK